jgi:hypothetical protein
MYVVLVASVMGSLAAIVLGLSALSLSAEVAPPAPVRVAVQTRRIEDGWQEDRR